MLKVCRSVHSRGEDTISIEVKDQDSGVIVADLTLGLSEFAQVITGLSVMDIPCNTWALDWRLGNKVKTELRQALCPLTGASKEEYSAWLEENVEIKEGEAPSFYLGSQTSISRTTDGTILRYWVRSWPTSDSEQSSRPADGR